MTTILHLTKCFIRFRAGARAFLADAKGASLLELALALPILAMLFMGVIEISRVVLLDQKIARIAANVADLAARTTTPSTSDIDQVFEAVRYIAQPFQLGDSDLVILTSVSRDEATNQIRVNWQRSGVGEGLQQSRIGAPGDIADLPADIELREGQGLIIGEAFFDYAPIFFSGFKDTGTVYHAAYYRPRDIALNLEQDGGGSGGGGSGGGGGGSGGSGGGGGHGGGGSGGGGGGGGHGGGGGGGGNHGCGGWSWLCWW